MKVIKRDGREVSYDLRKIKKAIEQANKCMQSDDDKLLSPDFDQFLEEIDEMCLRLHNGTQINIEDIQDCVEDLLIGYKKYKLAKHYIKYRYERALARKADKFDARILTILDNNNEIIKQENANKNTKIIPTQRDYMAGELNRRLAEDLLLPEDVVRAHKEGLIHVHDTDFFAQPMTNCCLINLEDMLQNGTVISDTYIDKPHRFLTACNIATQIIAQVASSQYGGSTISLTHLAPFIDISRQEYKKKYPTASQEIRDALLKEEIKAGVQTLQYQIQTLMTTNGQTPFVTVFMYLGETDNPLLKADLATLIEEVLRQRLEGIKNTKGVRVTAAFPKLIYVLEEDNIHKDSPYYWLTELAVRCTAKRMVPDYVSEKIMKQIKGGDCFPLMGCRSALSYRPDHKYYGRLNKGVVTVNLVDAALSSGGDDDKFWQILDERLELCHKAHMARYKRLKGTKSDVAPILWQHGALARLKSGETIDSLLSGDYSTISLGYAGLWEAVYYLTGGHKLTDKVGDEYGKAILKHMNDKCDEWNAELNLGFSIYGTPIESTTYKFAKLLQKRYGIIKNVTDKNYITNSYHIHVTEPIDAFTKLKIEAGYQELSKGGCISYIEVPDMQKNLDAVMSVVQFIYDNIMYAELNTKCDYCQECGYDGEIEIVEQDGKLIWRCPACGNTNVDKMNIVRRVCGYLGTQGYNQGRTQEIKERVLHL